MRFQTALLVPWTLLAAGALASACADEPRGESSQAACTNARDDDGDGFVDCADQDCLASSVCGGDVTGDITVGAGDVDVSGSDAPETAVCDPCVGRGSLVGRVCAPNMEVFVQGATVSLLGTGCKGEPFSTETTTGPDGSYSFLAVPCGTYVLRMESGSFRSSFEVTVRPGERIAIGGGLQKACFGANAARIAVLDGTYDNISGLLDTLGFRHDFFNKDGDAGADGAIVDLLSDPERLFAYDIVFAECGAAVGWLPQDAPGVMPNIRDFVLAGGSLYMSDYAWVLGEWAFPDKVEWYGDDDPAGMGRPGSPQVIPTGHVVEATVTDGDLAAYLGRTTLPIRFDDGPQVAPERVSNGAFAHVVATLNVPTSFNIPSAPLVLSYVPGQGAGRVVYTNFHHDAQTTADMLTLLRYLVFKL
jgi:hypothetical protein